MQTQLSLTSRQQQTRVENRRRAIQQVFFFLAEGKREREKRTDRLGGVRGINQNDGRQLKALFILPLPAEESLRSSYPQRLTTAAFSSCAQYTRSILPFKYHTWTRAVSRLLNSPLLRHSNSIVRCIFLGKWAVDKVLGFYGTLNALHLLMSLFE